MKTKTSNKKSAADTKSNITGSRKDKESNNRLKTAFLNTISHEIRTSLNGILGFASLMVEPDITDDEKQAFLQILNSCGENLIQKVTNKMDISLILSGKMEVRNKRFAPGLIIEELIKKYRPLCLKRNIEFSAEIQPEIRLIQLDSDRELVGKVLDHFLNNAIKFTKQGSICARAEINGNFIEFSIKDTGNGISPEALEIIFERFMPDDVSNTGVIGRSGLGLSIVKSIADLLGGKVWVESIKGEGSTFFFALPCEMPSEKPIEKKASEKTPSKANRPVILIAEDEQYNFLYLEIILKVDYVLFRAEDGEKAIELCRNHPEIALVLMDIKMPKINGLDATTEIKKFRNDLPIIALTAYAQSGDQEKCLAAGCDDYLSKPFTKSSLLSKLEQFVLR